MPITEQDVAALSQAMADVLREILPEYVQKAIAPLEATVHRIDGDVGTLQQKALRFAGTWQAATVYDVGDVVQRSGSLWRCTQKHSAHEFDHRFF